MNVYDFDNTLYDGESGVQMFFFYLKRKPSVLRYAPVILWGVARYKMGKMGIDDVVRKYDRIFSAFVEIVKDPQADAKVFWDKHQHRIRDFYKPLQKPDDLIISASPEQSLEEICGRLGIARWIGTRVNIEKGRFDFICFRENKVRAFREKFPGERIENFYTDSMNDKPLMDLADHVFFMKKGKLERIK